MLDDVPRLVGGLAAILGGPKVRTSTLKGEVGALTDESRAEPRKVAMFGVRAASEGAGRLAGAERGMTT